MNYMYKDYKKLKDLEMKAYLIHQDFLNQETKINDVIASSKAYSDFLYGLKSKYKNNQKENINMGSKSSTTSNKINKASLTLTPIEKFQERNKENLVTKHNEKLEQKENRKIRIFAIGIVLTLLAGAYVMSLTENFSKSSAWEKHLMMRM